MNVLNFLDANVWLALIWNRHVHSERARQWFQAASEEEFLFCRFTQMTVLRLLTTGAVMGKDVQTMSAAWELWDSIWSDERIAFVAEPETFEREFRARTRGAGKSPKVWADAYLLSFAALLKLNLVTFDRALQQRGVEVLVL